MNKSAKLPKGLTSSALGAIPLGVWLLGLTQPYPTPAAPPPADNIYHERDQLPDDADVFPRMGTIAGPAETQTNCRAAPWGRVVTQISGGSFLEISRRQVDNNSESWFYNSDLQCWIHDSRIDLL